MPETIKLRGVEYPVERFSDVHAQVLGELIYVDNGEWKVANFAKQCEVAEVLAEAICPGLLGGIISLTPNKRYVFKIDLTDIVSLALQVLRVVYSRKLQSAKVRQAKTEIAENKKWLNDIDGYLASLTGLVGEGDQSAIARLSLEDESSESLATQNSPSEAIGRIEELELQLAELKTQAAAANYNPDTYNLLAD